MRILFLNNSFCGGAERMTLLYAKILAQNGFDCRIGIWNIKNVGFQIKPFMPEGVPYDIINSPQKLLNFNIARYIWKHKPDIVFSSLPFTVKAILKMKKFHLLKAKTVVRECNMPSRQKDIVRKIATNYYRFADAIIAQTNEMAEEISQVYHINPSKIHTIYNPTDKKLIENAIKEQAGLDKKYINYVGVGRVARQKDFMTMCKAFNIVHQDNPMTRLYIIGNYSDDKVKKELDVFIYENHLDDAVVFAGFQDNPYKYLNEADVFLLSSVKEGLPNVMLDAMFLRKPVVVTKSIPFIAQTVKDGINGFAVEVGDYKDFAIKMKKATNMVVQQDTIDINLSESHIVQLFSTI